MGQAVNINIKIYLILPKETLKIGDFTFFSIILCYANNIKSRRKHTLKESERS